MRWSSRHCNYLGEALRERKSKKCWAPFPSAAKDQVWYRIAIVILSTPTKHPSTRPPSFPSFPFFFILPSSLVS